MKVIIVEDEAAAANILKYMLNTITRNIEVVDTATGVTDAYAKINFHKPGLIFLDIKLSDGNAFDLLKKFHQIDFKIIFTTAYNDYAIKAIKHSAIDYLLKPIEPIELRKAISRATNIINEKEKYNQMLEILQEHMENNKEKVVLNTGNGKCVIQTNEILRLEADGAYTQFVLNDRKVTVSKNIKYYQELLDEKLFIRTHQSHLVNKDKIVGYEAKGFVILSNNEKIPVSVRKRQIIKSIFKKKRKN